ncbi:MAG: hypothetical protein EOP53_07775 [Sphingobacteriales bacterium]|nr:MAG: hypothetical protein EOP53_07775 [Sphingobacteriales bacterium]
MLKQSVKIRHKAERFYEWLFPREIQLSGFLQEVLELVYQGKDIEWKQVKFYYGLPWFMYYAGNEASTMPATYDSHSIHVYYRKSMWSPHSIRGISTVVHECFHVMQFRQVLDGWGLGFFRFFLVLYFSGYASLGRSRKHLIELPAFTEEDKFRECFENAVAELSITDPEEDFYERHEAVLEKFAASCSHISPHAYNINYWQLMHALTPGAFRIGNHKLRRILFFPWMLTWNIIAFSATVFIAILKPILEGILLFGYFILLSAAGVLSLIGM